MDHALEIQVRCASMFSRIILRYFHILGGGFYVKVGSWWVLRGIISVSTIKDNFHCDVGRYAVYTMVAEFYSWIKNITGEIV